jgi:hypothetical protein
LNQGKNGVNQAFRVRAHLRLRKRHGLLQRCPCLFMLPLECVGLAEEVVGSD